MRKILGIMAIILLIGCASVGHKIDQSATDKIEKGKTTKEQVLNLMGSPDQIIRLGNGDTTFTYLYIRSTLKPETLIPFVGMFVGGSNMQHQAFSVTFDPDNVVKDLVSTQGSMECDTGLTTGNKPEISDVEEGKRPK